VLLYERIVWRHRSCEVLMSVSRKWEIVLEAYGVKLMQSAVKSGVHKFSENLETTKKLQEPVAWLETFCAENRRFCTGMWSSLLSGTICLMFMNWVHVFVCEGEKTNSCACGVRCHGAKLSHPSGLEPGVCAPLSEVRMLCMFNWKYASNPNMKMKSQRLIYVYFICQV
jgi:hypothetical protein